MNNLTHSKQGQQPLLYLEVEYDEKFDGYLGDLRRYLTIDLKKQDAFRTINDLEIDFSNLSQAIDCYREKGYIKQVKIWENPFLKAFKQLPEGINVDLLAPITY
ncbi:CRISPR-associated protein, Csh2 family [Lachnospiraceae bacterium TWA4]|nr:CRISPR-associated protein, Csh2 family [Lachnospiraceae bacterium TWA4]